MSDPFRIEFERSGGFAGVALRASIDSSELTPEEARAIEELLERAGQGELAGAADSAGGQRGADRFQYDITLERAGERRHVQLGEQALPQELRPLVERLLQRARSPGA